MFKLVFCFAVLVVAGAEDPVRSCDNIWSTIIRGCLELRSSIVVNAQEPKSACCNNIKFQACVRAARGYATVAKLTRVCASDVYDQKLASLEAPIDLISTVCPNFSAQSCVTDSISSYWNQFDSKAIGETVEQNFNSAVNQISSLAQSFGQTINEQRIPEQFSRGAESIRNAINEKAKDMSKAISPNKDVNRYLIVDDNKPTGSGVDELVDSIFPSVEIITKDPSSEPKPQDTTRPGGTAFMEWFKSGYDRASTFMQGVGKGATANKQNDATQPSTDRANRYSSQ